MSQHAAESGIQLEVENIGGIDETQVSLNPGVTVLAGRNATNRTSLLQAIMAALGSNRATLKADAEEGFASLSFDGKKYERYLRRENDTVVLDGDPYLDDPEEADLFAFLLEDNEARRAVSRGGDLRDVIMRTVDTEAIQTEIGELSAQKRRVSKELSELDDLERRLPELEAEKADLEERIQEKEAELSEKKARIDDVDGAVEDEREVKAELEEVLEELHETRSELDDIRYDLETNRESLDSLREKKSGP